MLTVTKIASKLYNDGFKLGMESESAINILNHCVAPVACVKFFISNMDEVLNQIRIWENADKIEATNLGYDVNGNRLFFIPSRFLSEREAKALGGRKNRRRALGIGFVFQTSHIEGLKRDIAKFQLTGER